MKALSSIGFILAFAVAGAVSPAQTAPPQHVLPANCTSMTKPFVGTICAPAGDPGKHPAMILLGGSEGGDSLSRIAPAFASHGYVAASVAYFAAPGLPQTLVNVPVETIKSAIDVLQSRPDVNANAIGIMGGSKGGELALLAASTYPQIKAVVAVVPSPFAYMGLGEFNAPTGCSWSENGKPLPCVPPDSKAGAKIGEAFQAHQPIVLAPFYDASRNADPQLTSKAFFPLQKIDGPVLCLSGDDDKMWNSDAQCALTMQYLRDHHHGFGDAQVAYPNAGHTFISAVRGPQSAVTSVTDGPVTMAFGGTAQGDVAAASAAWPKIWDFLAKALGA